ncbi:MAG: SIR2 family protein [Solirubrobacteraceae bacterium]
MLAEQRVIPFIGAGVSAALELPQWETLLKTLTEEIQRGSPPDETVSYEEVRDACKGDYLQMAEYLFLCAGETIGPIRYALNAALQAPSPLIDSTPHVELVNLAASQVYTTNFDDLIEESYRALGRPVSLIAIARDVALADPERTHVVKYHGDLRHEDTLVLTESQYYTRLEFESPMDLKLRSDLLGRAVLFIGYSFSDINIRVIWFKLMQTMKQVPEKDRLPSYIVRLRSNPVLDRLYEAVGLTTIVIDPAGVATDHEGEKRCLADFMLNLTMAVARARRSPAPPSMFVSSGLLDAVVGELETTDLPRAARIRLRRMAPNDDGPVIRPSAASTALVELLVHLTEREIPPPLLPRCLETVDLIAGQVAAASSVGLAGRLASWILGPSESSAGATLLVGGAMAREATRDAVFAFTIPWDRVWAARLGDSEARYLLELFSSEVEGHMAEDPYEDHDVAFLADIAKRVADGSLVRETNGISEQARELLNRLAEVYPSVLDYDPPLEGKPMPTEIINEIDEKIAERQEDEGEQEE